MTPDDITDAVVTEAGITFTELRGRDRAHKFVRPRQLAAYLLRQNFPDLSYVKIGKLLGGREPNTIWHACDRMPDFIRCEQKTGDLYRRVQSRLGTPS